MNKWKNIKLDDETMWPKEGLVKLELHIPMIEASFKILLIFQ